jgi:hypothetical protein
MKECGIYSISCPDGEYIGASQNIEARWKQHQYALLIKQHPNQLLTEAANKYDIEDFELRILERCSINQLAGREQFWMIFKRQHLLNQRRVANPIPKPIPKAIRLLMLHKFRHGQTLAHIGRQLNLPPGTVALQLMKAGLTPEIRQKQRCQNTEKVIQKASQLWKAGFSTRQVAKQCQTSHITISRWLKAINITSLELLQRRIRKPRSNGLY